MKAQRGVEVSCTLPLTWARMELTESGVLRESTSRRPFVFLAIPSLTA